MDSKIRQIHMVGIGGAGMSGIAEVLLNLGYDISGSDMSDSAVVKHLRSLGARIAVGHAAENVGNVQVLVKSTAIAEDNPEVVEARRRNIAIIPRAEMLAELMRLRQGVAIAGTHGKTTTTSLTASIFDTAGLDPTVIIGGRLNVYGTNAHLGSGHYLIAEADESDGSFLCLFPIINVVTNVDEDHLDHYGTRQAIDDAFVQFMNKVPFYGLNVVCGDDPGVRALLPRVKRPVLTYGFAADNQLRAVLLESGMTSRFEVWRDDQKLGEVSLPHPGRHNILNALAASFEGRNEYISRLCRYPLLILDDFGMERGTEYGLEQVFNVIDSRYRSGKPLIVTTNLTLDGLRNPEDTAHSRIYDRLLSMCVPVRFTGDNFRQEAAQRKMESMKKLIVG